MPKDQYEGLKTDIARNGLREPIDLWHDMVIDGRARQEACLETKTRPRYRTCEFADELEAWGYIASRNLHRQHMKAEARFAAWLRAAERNPALRELMDEQRDKCDRRMRSGKPGKGPSYAAWLGKMGGASRSTAQRVVRLRQTSVTLFNKIADGQMTAGQALKKLTQMNRIVFRQAGRYDVFLADPPWDYNASGDYSPTASDANPALHYPTASLEEILAMDVRSIANKDAALFLWSPASYVEKALQVVRAWGFYYRTCWVWSKESCGYGAGIGWGGWLMVRHEILLIATRGGMSPEIAVRPPSVLTAPVTEHSRKPACFRDHIAQMFPRARKIELFARERADGWDVWGDEV
jgi:N6-adenosine-specific RNA methylase IME4